LVRAVVKSDAKEPHFGKSSYRPKEFHVMLCDVMNYNDVVFTTDSLELVKDVCFTDI